MKELLINLFDLARTRFVFLFTTNPELSFVFEHKILELDDFNYIIDGTYLKLTYPTTEIMVFYPAITSIIVEVNAKRAYDVIFKPLCNEMTTFRHFKAFDNIY